MFGLGIENDEVFSKYLNNFFTHSYAFVYYYKHIIQT